MNGDSRGAEGSCVGWVSWQGLASKTMGWVPQPTVKAALTLTGRHVFTLQEFYTTRTHCLKRPGTLTSSTLLRWDLIN